MKMTLRISRMRPSFSDETQLSPLLNPNSKNDQVIEARTDPSTENKTFHYEESTLQSEEEEKNQLCQKKRSKCSSGSRQAWQQACLMIEKALNDQKSTKTTDKSPDQMIKRCEIVKKCLTACLSLLVYQLKHSEGIQQQDFLPNMIVKALEMLEKYPTACSDVITLYEQLFKMISKEEPLRFLQCFAEAKLRYVDTLLRCGLVQKAQQLFDEIEGDQTTHRFGSCSLSKETNLGGQRKGESSNEQSMWLCLRSECMREQGKLDLAIQLRDRMINPRTKEAFELIIKLQIDSGELKQALYLAEQGIQIFVKHEQREILVRLMNLELKILILQKKYSEAFGVFAKTKEICEENGLLVSLEFCESLCLESQGHFEQQKYEESLLSLDEANNIAKLILQDRYNQSAIMANIYFMKAQTLLEFGTSAYIRTLQTKERTKMLKKALGLSSLCLHLRKDYLYVKSEKNSKVIQTLALHADLLAACNRKRESRSASAELMEYELL